MVSEETKEKELVSRKKLFTGVFGKQ